MQVRGLFFGDPSQLVAQIIGMVVCFVYVFGISWIFFALYKRLFGLRKITTNSLSFASQSHRHLNNDARSPPWCALDSECPAHLHDPFLH